MGGGGVVGVSPAGRMKCTTRHVQRVLGVQVDDLAGAAAVLPPQLRRHAQHGGQLRLAGAELAKHLRDDARLHAAAKDGVQLLAARRNLDAALHGAVCGAVMALCTAAAARVGSHPHTLDASSASEPVMNPTFFSRRHASMICSSRRREEGGYNSDYGRQGAQT